MNAPDPAIEAAARALHNITQEITCHGTPWDRLLDQTRHELRAGAKAAIAAYEAASWSRDIEDAPEDATFDVWIGNTRLPDCP